MRGGERGEITKEKGEREKQGEGEEREEERKHDEK